MWPFTEPINEWFEEIKRKRKENTTDDSGDEIAPMDSNEDPRLRRLREG